jgi:hypothetical protein
MVLLALPAATSTGVIPMHVLIVLLELHGKYFLREWKLHVGRSRSQMACTTQSERNLAPKREIEATLKPK